MSDPILQTWRRRRANYFRATGRLRVARSALIPALASLALVPLVQPVFFKFLSQPPDRWGEGLTAVAVRAALLLVAVQSIDAYGALIRGRDRAVLSLLPVDPAAATRLAAARTLVEGAYLPLVLCVLLAPLLMHGAPGAFALGCLVILGAWPLGVAAACTMHLLAVDVARSPKWAPLLDLVRGNNPRAQAAFLYAPGLILTIAGGAVVISATGAGQVYAGHLGAAWTLAVPPALAVAFVVPLAPLARRSWFAASIVLADIDARYARLIDPSEQRRVYLEGLARFLPEPARSYALTDLRSGWRDHRAWITATWAAGFAAALLAWSDDPASPGRATAAVGAILFLAGGLGAVLSRDEPDFLRVWLPPRGLAGWGARALVSIAWAQGGILPATAAIGVRHGIGHGLIALGSGEGVAAVAALLAWGSARFQRRATWVYAPVAAVAAAAWAAGWMGGA